MKQKTTEFSKVVTVLFLCIVISICCEQFIYSQANIYYVDFADGDDNNDGLSPETAWQHCPGDDNATASPASVNLEPGNKTIFKGGVEYLGRVDIDWSGTENNPITYDGNSDGSWGEGKAIIDGGGEELGINARKYCFFAAGKGEGISFITIDNFEIRDIQYYREDSYNNRGYGIKIQGSGKGIEIKNCYLHDMFKTPVAIIEEKDPIGNSITETSFTDTRIDFSSMGMASTPGQLATHRIIFGFQREREDGTLMPASDYDRCLGYIGEVNGSTLEVYKDIYLTDPGWASDNEIVELGVPYFDNRPFYWIFDLRKGSSETVGNVGIFVGSHTNVEIHDNTVSHARIGIRTIGADNINIYNNDITMCSWGINAAGTAPNPVTNIKVYNNKIHDFYPFTKYLWGWHNNGMYLWGQPWRGGTVKDKDISDPPADPQQGDRYIVGPSATGLWLGQENNIAEWSGTEWEFTALYNGLCLKVEDENIPYYFDGTSLIVAPNEGVGLRNVEVYNNHFYGDMRPAATGMIYFSECVQDIKIYNNVFASPTGTGHQIEIGGPSNNISIFNNTLAKIPGEEKYGLHAAWVSNITIKNNIFYLFDRYGTCMNLSSYEPETISCDYNLLHTAHVGQVAVTLDNRRGERVGYTIEQWQALDYNPLGYDQNSIVEQDPLFRNFPSFAAKTNAQGSTTRIYYALPYLHDSYPTIFEIGDHIEYEYDKVVRTITAVGSDATGDYIEIDIPLANNSVEYEYLLNWKDNTDLNIDLTLQENSPVINAGVNLSGLISNVDIDGVERDQQWDIGAYEYTTATNIFSTSTESKKNFRIYPNPFTNTATIEYTLPKGSDVEITLYDLTGRIIKHLYSGYQSSGIHALNINAGGLGEGVYLYRIQTGLYDLTMKCIVSE